MRNLLLLIAFLGLFSSATAFSERDVGVVDNVYLNQEKVVPISIENNSLEDKELEVEFIGPARMNYNFSNVPDEIKASNSRRIELFLSPSFEMEGTTYNSTLIVKLGQKTVLKEIKLHVSNILPQTPTPTPTIHPSPSPSPAQGFYPFAFLGSMEGSMSIVLFVIVVVLFIIFIAKLWSMKKHREVEFLE